MKTTEMIEAANMVGGSFKLTALLQRRVLELMRGAPALVDVRDKRDLIDTALREVLAGKITLVVDEEDEDADDADLGGLLSA